MIWSWNCWKNGCYSCVCCQPDQLEFRPLFIWAVQYLEPHEKENSKLESWKTRWTPWEGKLQTRELENSLNTLRRKTLNPSAMSMILLLWWCLISTAWPTYITHLDLMGEYSYKWPKFYVGLELKNRSCTCIFGTFPPINIFRDWRLYHQNLSNHFSGIEGYTISISPNNLGIEGYTTRTSPIISQG